MALGRKTGGRQKGTPNKATAAKAAEVAASGLTPLDWMLQVMRDDNAPMERRDEMAKAAAPYVHPRLAAVAYSGSVRARNVQDMTNDELMAIIRGDIETRTGRPNGHPARPAVGHHAVIGAGNDTVLKAIATTLAAQRPRQGS
jgi:hypothetical protein